MPIKGLTDQPAELPIIGTLRKGDEKKGNAPGKDLTYFRFTSDDVSTVQAFYEVYPDEPRRINGYLPYRTTDENLPAWLEKWVAGGLIYRSDGETVVLWRTDKGAYSEKPKPDPKPGVGPDGKRTDGSHQVGRLRVIIPELGRLALVNILTTSKHDIINLTRQLRSYEAINGDLRGIPFIITRRPVKISTPSGSNGKRTRREKWLLSIETQPHWTMLQIKAMEHAALPNVPETHLIPETIPGDYELVSELPSDVIPPVEATPEPPPNGSPKPRQPLNPTELLEVLQKKIDASNFHDPSTREPLPIKLHPFGDKTASLISAKFRAIFETTEPQAETEPAPADKYHACLQWLFQVSSAKDLTAAQADAVLDWLLNGNKAQKWSAQVVDPAPEEARRIYRETLLAAGQLDMFDDEPVLDEVFPREAAYAQDTAMA